MRDMGLTRINAVWKDPTDESGMALVTALLILVALTALALTAMTNTTINTKIAGNDYRAKQTFHRAEGCAEVAANSLESILAGTTLMIDEVSYTFNNIDDLLGFDRVDGNITPVLNAYLQEEEILVPGEDINVLCNPESGKDYTIHIRDNKDKDGDLHADRDGIFSIYSRYADGDQQREMVQITLGPVSPPPFGGAVNLINPDGDGDTTKSNVKIKVEKGSDPENWEGEITGSSLDAIAGIATTNSYTGIDADDDGDAESRIVPSVKSVSINYHPTGNELDEFVDRLLHGRDPDLVQKKILIDNDHNTELLGTAESPKVTYVKGKIKTGNTVNGYGVLIIDDYYDKGDCENKGGIDANDRFTYHGLVILRYRNPDHKGKIEIKLSEDAKIYGAVIAYSEDQSKGIKFTIKESASVVYDPESINNALKKFLAKDGWAFLNNCCTSH